jgi:DNA repair protein RecO
MEKTSAILINRHRLTETSLIVHWCSAEAGLFKTVAKGALRPKSAFAGLDLLVTCEVGWVPARVSDLHTLKEVRLVEARMGLRRSYSRVLAATYFCKLLELVAETQTPLPGIYGLLELSLDHLESHDPSVKLVERFEDRLCVELGLGEVLPGEGGAMLKSVFHRALPKQRDDLWRELDRSGGIKGDGLKNS